MSRFSERLGKVAKVDNHARSMPDKVALRRRVLEAVPSAQVFDAFAGSGQMYQRVWRDAPGYVGCDLRWFPDDRVAFVADNRRVLRSIDLGAFGIFDLDAYGSPWEQALIVAGRRMVRPGELVGLCLTEGSMMKLKLGGLPKALAQVAGLRPTAVGAAQSADEIMQRAITGLADRMRCRIAKAWMARGKSAAEVRYYGLVFEGVTPAPAH